MDKSKVPKKKRKREVPKEIEDFIIRYREEHPGVGKETIKYNLDGYCKERGIKKISEFTVGRIIKDLKEKGKIRDKRKKLSLDGRTGNLYERKKKKRMKKLRLKGYKPEKLGDLVQIDSICKFVDGVKRYIITAVDVYSRFSFAYIYKSLSSLSGVDFMKKFLYVAPFKIKNVQTDNGKEFEKYFKNYLECEKIPRYFNYPKHPQNNSLVERFNRTLNEQWIECEKEHLQNLKLSNLNLIDYLIWFNTHKPHKSLNCLPPLKFIFNNANIFLNKKSHRLWTLT